MEGRMNKDLGDAPGIVAVAFVGLCVYILIYLVIVWVL